MIDTIAQEVRDVVSRLEAIDRSLKTDKSSVESLETEFQTISSIARQIRRRYIPNKSSAVRTRQKDESTDPALMELNDTLSIVRDRVKGVAIHGHAGFYLYGRAGTSKTFTVRTALDELEKDYVYQNGHVTPIGLFEVFEHNPDGIIVIDDVASIFQQATARNILLAALGSQPDGSREIRYTRSNRTVRVRFRGGVIAISNIELHGDEVMAALKSRVQTLNYNPTDEQIVALMRSIAQKGYQFEDARMTPKQCQNVAEFVVEQGRRLEIRPDVRMLVDKAFRDFILWKSKDSETHWKDLVRSSMEDQLVKLEVARRKPVPTKEEETELELDLIRTLIEKNESPDDVVAEFMKLTGKSKRTCQRRIREARMAGVDQQ
ncbi:hypothetical protein CA54_41350 [Symmachiella macrocystis]|uniref:AAA+ ATPase domain-containing protein n=1 Tax=Symmachiella macrocystis TaxID=2527985 RepID=A0A5C6BC77_9PLAN|nr:hypothetical protein [Symmachiella macrocystis]TWU08896.1 hypothetical protein CA54_41350 [Symmachiella macrocystis]